MPTPNSRSFSFRYPLITIALVGALLTVIPQHGFAQEKATPAAAASPQLSPQKDAAAGNPITPEKMQELRKHFGEVSKKMSEDPQLAELKAKLIAAQKDYQTAFETAMNKVEPGLVDKKKGVRWRILTGSRIDE